MLSKREYEIQFYNDVNKAALRYGKFKTFDEEEEQQYTGAELAAQISSIANLNGNEYQKAKHLFHERMIKNKYVPSSPNLFKILTSRNSWETVSYQDLVHNQKIRITFHFLFDASLIIFKRPYSGAGISLWIAKKQIDFFNSSDKNTEKDLIRLLKKIDTMIFDSQKKQYMPKKRLMPKDNHMQNQNHQQLVKSEIKTEIKSEIESDEDLY